MTQKYLPESMYNVDRKLTRSKLTLGDVITVKVICYKHDKKLLVVDLGTEYGVIPIEESSIYPKYHPSGILHGSIYKLIGKNIRAKVISIDDEVTLSRKSHMLEALDYFKANNPAIFEKVSITAFSRVSAFVDIGAGIIGRICAFEFCTTSFSHIKDVGLEVGDIIPVSNLGYDESILAFNLSRKSLFPKFEDIYSIDDIVSAKVFRQLDDGIGYLCLIDTKISAILDSNVELNYGDKIIATVKSLSTKGPRLEFLSM